MDGKENNSWARTVALQGALALLYAVLAGIASFVAVKGTCTGTVTFDRPLPSADPPDRTGGGSWRSAEWGPCPGSYRQ